jgi:hypothetical protein
VSKLVADQETRILAVRADIVASGETNSAGGPSCGVLAEELAALLGGSELYGAYRLDDGRAPEHAWVLLADGTIVDASADQFGCQGPLRVLHAGDDDYNRYLDQDGDDQ